MRYYVIRLLIGLLVLVFTNCNRTQMIKMGSKRHIKLSHQAIFNHRNNYSKILMDSLLTFRDTFYPDNRIRRQNNLKPNNEFVDSIKNNPLFSLEGFCFRPFPLKPFSIAKEDIPFEKKNLPNDKFKLIIPDSLKKNIGYLPEDFHINEKGDGWVFFSPLLPTKDKGVYFQQSFYNSYPVFQRDSSIAVEIIDNKAFVAFYIVHKTSFFQLKRNKIFPLKHLNKSEVFFFSSAEIVNNKDL